MRWATGGALLLLMAGCSTTPTQPSTPASTVPSMASTTAESPTAHSSQAPSLAGPYIASAIWRRTTHGPMLQVIATDAGRMVTAPDAERTAWNEVLKLEPGAAGTSMFQQFQCHWRYARGKATWNLEPWRPVVSTDEMVQAYCNPGGPE